MVVSQILQEELSLSENKPTWAYTHSPAEQDTQPKKKQGQETKNKIKAPLQVTDFPEAPLYKPGDFSVCPPDVSPTSLVRLAERWRLRSKKERGGMNLQIASSSEKERAKRSRGELSAPHPLAWAP